jgi:hypothetical protein
MNIEDIEKFINANKLPEDKYLKITFRKRNPVYGIFVHGKDASDLQSKNFWRVVTLTKFKEYQVSKDINLSSIFHGSEFSRIAIES